MKKSNLLMLVAALLLVVALFTYNTALKAEYLTGAHKKPYRDFTDLNLKDFDAVAVNAATEVSVTIKASDTTKVLVRKDDAENIKIKVVNNVLHIDVSYPKERRNFDARERVIITMPKVKSVSTDGNFTQDGKLLTYGLEGGKHEVKSGKNSKSTWYDPNNGRTLITGFNQDSLFIQQSNATRVELKKNKLEVLRAITGQRLRSHTWMTYGNSSLTLSANNSISAADLDIRGASTLIIDKIFIPKLNYKFSDSANVNLSGAALAILKK